MDALKNCDMLVNKLNKGNITDRQTKLLFPCGSEGSLAGKRDRSLR